MKNIFWFLVATLKLQVYSHASLNQPFSLYDTDATVAIRRNPNFETLNDDALNDTATASKSKVVHQEEPTEADAIDWGSGASGINIPVVLFAVLIMNVFLLALECEASVFRVLPHVLDL